MPKIKVPLTPEERLKLAKRYLKNAKEVLKKSPIDREAGVYEDIKYVSEALGTAYISALEALRALFMFKKGWDVERVKKETKEVGSYRRILKTLPIGKDKDVLIKLFSSVYDILHLGGYYRELRSKKAIDDGFEKVRKIIKIVERHINDKG